MGVNEKLERAKKKKTSGDWGWRGGGLFESLEQAMLIDTINFRFSEKDQLFANLLFVLML